MQDVRISKQRLDALEKIAICASEMLNCDLGVDPDQPEYIFEWFYDRLVVAVREYTEGLGAEGVPCAACKLPVINPGYLNGMIYCNNDNRIGLTCYDNAWIGRNAKR